MNIFNLSLKLIAVFIASWATLVSQAFAADFKKWNVYPFSLEVADSLQPFSEREREMFRANFTSQSADLYKRYHGVNDNSFSAAPYIAAFRTPDFGLMFVAIVMRIPPQPNYLASITRDFTGKMEWGKKQGLIKDMRISAPFRLGNYDSITIESDQTDDGAAFVGILFDDELPYQVIMLQLKYSKRRVAEAREAFDHILKTIKIDYTLRGMVGRSPFVISKRCQEFFVITEISNPDAKNIVLIVQEPHWDYRAQWNLHQGLRVLFDENTNLLAKSVFLSEGTKAMERVSVSALTQIEPDPEPMLVKATLESFLITGYLSFNWMTQSQIPVIGTEEWVLYEESARLWKSGKHAPWVVTVAARNERMIEVLAQIRSRYDNPILFVGGMHMHAVNRELFAKGRAELNVPGQLSRTLNRGVKDWLKERGFDYIYIEPLPELSLQDDPIAMARYRELFAVQLRGSYDAYVEIFASDYRRRLAAGAYDDGVTVTPKPAEAAKLVAKLRKSGGGKGSHEGDDKASKDEGGSGIRKAIDRFKDALSKLSLRGRNLKSGRSAIRDADPNVTESKTDTGRHEWKDKRGQKRVAYDPSGGGGHWHKWSSDGTPIDNAGRPDNLPGKPTEHIPTK